MGSTWYQPWGHPIDPDDVDMSEPLWIVPDQPDVTLDAPLGPPLYVPPHDWHGWQDIGAIDDIPAVFVDPIPRRWTDEDVDNLRECLRVLNMTLTRWQEEMIRSWC